MRYVSSLPPVTTSPASRELKAVASVRAVRPVKARDEPVPAVEEYTHQPRQDAEEGLYTALADHRHTPLTEDRRKYCRRTQHVPVLLDLRSGYDRRRNRQRATDAVEHIDEEV